MVYYGVSASTAADMLTAEVGGDCRVIDENGKRIMPDWWHAGRTERRRNARRMLRYARRIAAGGTSSPEL
jgi:hypothetical protein